MVLQRLIQLSKDEKFAYVRNRKGTTYEVLIRRGLGTAKALGGLSHGWKVQAEIDFNQSPTTLVEFIVEEPKIVRLGNLGSEKETYEALNDY